MRHLFDVPSAPALRAPYQLARLALAVVTLLIVLTSPVLADDQTEFCAGFEEGYRSIEGDMVLLPLCPLGPLTPLGSTPFREGIKAGIAEALSD